MKRSVKLFVIALLVVGAGSCTTDINFEPELSIDDELISDAFASSAQFESLKSLAVFHKNKIVKEEYYRGSNANQPHDVRSVTKSVVGILTGIAIEKGYIQSVDQTIDPFIRPLVPSLSSEKGSIKIHDLLTMSGGFEWDELTSVSGYNNWINSENQIQYLINKPLIAPPGQRFTYNSAALHLLSVIINQATEFKTLEFANKKLFEPLEIGQRNWSSDRQGFNNGGAGLQITPHDMIKIGQLILNRGNYNGNRIVSSQWIDDLSTSKISTSNTMSFASGYGYCWWIGESPQGKYIFANGYGGQFIVVVPSLELVVVATNNWSGVSAAKANDNWNKTLNLIITKILPAVKSI